MKGLDTNILVRYITRDNLVQSRKADELLESLTPFAPGFVSLVSLIELVWVLRSQYRMPKSRQIECLERLLDLSVLVIENNAAVVLALSGLPAEKPISPIASLNDWDTLPVVRKRSLST
jgi:predicted nucleic-acid-binding protein